MISKPIATMKNLFKNLMLVAVAAMAFTACTETNDEVNAVVNKTRYEFTANIAEETRSGFAEKEEGATAYKSEWHEGDQVKIFVDGYDPIVKNISVDGKFELELENAPESFFMTVVSPAESWSSQSSCTIPTEQTPLANSVDPKAHLLQAQNVSVSNGSADAINMTHQKAYGKMTVNGVDFAIDHVVVDLKGTFYSYDRELSYTINATNVQNNTFWFATEPIDVAEFTVTAYDAQGNSVAKTVDVAAAGKTMSFQYGRVGTFSVSGLEEAAVPMFTSAAYNGNSGDKVVKLYSDTLGELWMNFYGSNSLLSNDNWINPGQYGKDNGMYFGSNYGQYKPVGFSQFLTAAPNWFTLDVSIVDGKYKFVINADYTNMYDGVVLENATFIGEIPGLGMPDMRTPLATPEVTYELNGKTLTVSWTPVDGAVGYYVHDYYYDIDTTITDTTLTVELSEYKWYYIYVTALAVADDANVKNSAEAEISFELRDPRTVLSVPANVNATVDGRYATIEWSAVRGADYYTLYYYQNGDHYIDVTSGTSHTIDVGFNVSNLWVYVFAKANDDNPDYKSSTSWDANVVVNTGKDPDMIAQYMWDGSFVWQSSGYFQWTDGDYGSGCYLNLYLNAADRPGNNSIKPGVYYGTNSASPGVGEFSVKIGGTSFAPFYSIYNSYINSTHELEVKVVDDQYVIVFTYGSESHGYKGKPDGFVLPSEGDDSGDDSGDGFIQMTKLYYDSSAANLHNFILTNDDQSSKLTLSFNNQDVLNSYIPVYTYTSQSLNNANSNPGYFTLQYADAKINGTSYSLGATGHTLKVLSASNGGNHEMELYVVTSNGTEYKFRFSGSLGL